MGEEVSRREGRGGGILPKRVGLVWENQIKGKEQGELKKRER